MQLCVPVSHAGLRADHSHVQGKPLIFAQEHCHDATGLDLLVPVKGKCNAAVYKDILENLFLLLFDNRLGSPTYECNSQVSTYFWLCNVLSETPGSILTLSYSLCKFSIHEFLSISHKHAGM